MKAFHARAECLARAVKGYWDGPCGRALLVKGLS